MRTPPFLRRMARRLSATRGGATVEFVIVFPIFIVMFLSAFEAAMLMTRQMMLERGVDVTVREMRLTTGANWSHDAIVNRVCRHARILRDCRTRTVIEMVEIDRTTYALPAADTPCVDTVNGVTPSTTWQNGGPAELMLIRACYAVETYFPGTGLGLVLAEAADHDGDNQPDSDTLQMMAASAFVLEPA